jgi:hypothetical protein
MTDAETIEAARWLITDNGAWRCSGPCGERHSLASQFPQECEQAT